MAATKEIVRENLVKLRKEHKLTQMELAEKIGYSDKAISKWERGESAPDVATLVQLADLGVNYIDTARGYTVSEEYLGQALEGIRDKFVIATKSMARTKEAMAADIDISLKNLRTDYIDLYQIHNPSAADLEKVQQPGGALEALQEAKAAGKIGHIGFTTHSASVRNSIIDVVSDCIPMKRISPITLDCGASSGIIPSGSSPVIATSFSLIT